ncbi:hypothetical protein swp_2651 [Shewanella piezotolerans WP3]|uniref:Uncharacterized protein n=1 Tax=Shewanella piezotolerans (strain WP3 / JCM 13877) TaxID=225849 RepID=B8CMJ7_SHEPW|nr:hypothetical protein swp_2651 [Shewanella piezotolerans WP3]
MQPLIPTPLHNKQLKDLMHQGSQPLKVAFAALQEIEEP